MSRYPNCRGHCGLAGRLTLDTRLGLILSRLVNEELCSHTAILIYEGPMPQTSEVEMLSRIISDLKDLGDEDRRRIFQTVATYFGYSLPDRAQRMALGLASPTGHEPVIPFAGSPNVTPKQFLLDKQPNTDVERIVCLAYYLTHYRDTPHFKTVDLTKLNTEAAQPKFSNAAYTTTYAMKAGYLAPAPKGQKQLSAAGEQFVTALPDRDAARHAMASQKRRSRNRRRPTATKRPEE
jgi:hypothetical protein